MSSHSMLGAYGSWAATLAGEGPNFLSFRHTHWIDPASWRPAARQRFRERVAMPDTEGAGECRIESQYEYDGLQVEELSWQLPYGPRTEAVLLKPAGAMVGLWQPKGHIGAQLVNMPNALVWNELQTKDVDTARSFYGTVFGWGHDQDPNGFHLFELGERMQAGMLKMDVSWGEMQPHWGVYFMSEDIEATAARVKELGGAVLVPPTDTGTVGRFAVIQDPQGGVFTSMQFDGPVDAPPGY